MTRRLIVWTTAAMSVSLYAPGLVAAVVYGVYWGL
jgi:hypothetical protein